MCVWYNSERICVHTTPCVTDLYLHSWGLIALVPGVRAHIYTTHYRICTQGPTHTGRGLGGLPAAGRCACLCLELWKRQREPTIIAVTQACLLRAAAWWRKLSNPGNYHSLKLRQGPCDITPAESGWIFYKDWLRCQMSGKLFPPCWKKKSHAFGKGKKVKRETGNKKWRWKKSSLVEKQEAFHFSHTTCYKPPPSSAVCPDHSPINCCLTSPRLH